MPKQRWEIELPGTWAYPRQYYAVPEIDSLYLLAGASFCKIGLSNGREMGSFLVRAGVNAFDIDLKRSEIMINTNKRLFLLSTDLREKRRWERRVPAYMHYILRFGNVLVMKNGAIGKGLILFDLDTATVSRKKCPSGWPLLRDIRKNSALVLCGTSGVVYRYNLGRDELSEICSDYFFERACLDQKGECIWLFSAVKRLDDDEEPERRRRSGSVVCCVSATDGRELRRFEIQCDPRHMSISSDGAYLWFADLRWTSNSRPGASTVRVYSTKKLKEVDRFNFPSGHMLSHIDAAANLVLTQTGESNTMSFVGGNLDMPDKFVLHCWRAS